MATRRIGPPAGGGAVQGQRGERHAARALEDHTLIVGLRLDGIVAPFVIDCPVNREVSETWIARALVPGQRPGDVVIMDNLWSHKGPRVRNLIEGTGASLLHLPPCSPDFNPIEKAFAKLKALLRKAAPGTLGTLWDTTGRLIKLITPFECANMFAAAGYDPH